MEGLAVPSDPSIPSCQTGKNMKKTLVITLATLGILFGGGALSSSEAAGPATPADITYACPNGDVTYSHAKHSAKYPVCTECHPTPFGMARSDLGMQKGHSGCGKCHKAGGPGPGDIAAADTCASCHKPKT
jgi:c(7)-type cytochrome triheme protein